METPRILTVLVEYSEERKRVTVRGVWPKADAKQLPKLLPSNEQNYVDVFEGVDMKWHVGFTGLIPEASTPNDPSSSATASATASAAVVERKGDDE
jgi:hypothetical protein